MNKIVLMLLIIPGISWSLDDFRNEQKNKILAMVKQFRAYNELSVASRKELRKFIDLQFVALQLYKDDKGARAHIERRIEKARKFYREDVVSALAGEDGPRMQMRKAGTLPRTLLKRSYSCSNLVEW